MLYRPFGEKNKRRVRIIRCVELIGPGSSETEKPSLDVGEVQAADQHRKIGVAAAVEAG